MVALNLITLSLSWLAQLVTELLMSLINPVVDKHKPTYTVMVHVASNSVIFCADIHGYMYTLFIIPYKGVRLNENFPVVIIHKTL
jgi:hypothetical protein